MFLDSPIRSTFQKPNILYFLNASIDYHEGEEGKRGVGRGIKEGERASKIVDCHVDSVFSNYRRDVRNKRYLLQVYIKIDIKENHQIIRLMTV